MDRTGPNCLDSHLAGLAGAARLPGTAASAVQMAVAVAVDTFLDVAVAVAVHKLWLEDKLP